MNKPQKLPPQVRKALAAFRKAAKEQENTFHKYRKLRDKLEVRLHALNKRFEHLNKARVAAINSADTKQRSSLGTLAALCAAANVNVAELLLNPTLMQSKPTCTDEHHNE